jgi:hypothetical protein
VSRRALLVAAARRRPRRRRRRGERRGRGRRRPRRACGSPVRTSAACRARRRSSASPRCCAGRLPSRSRRGRRARSSCSTLRRPACASTRPRRPRRRSSGGLLDQLRSRIGDGRDVDPVVEVDEPALRTAVEALAPAVAREPAEGSVRFDETPAPVAVPPVEGRALDVDGLGRGRARAVAARGTTASCRRGGGGRHHRAGTVQDAVREGAEPATAGPCSSTPTGQELVCPAAAIAQALTASRTTLGELGRELDPGGTARRCRDLPCRSVGTLIAQASFDCRAAPRSSCRAGDRPDRCPGRPVRRRHGGC